MFFKKHLQAWQLIPFVQGLKIIKLNNVFFFSNSPFIFHF